MGDRVVIGLADDDTPGGSRGQKAGPGQQRIVDGHALAQGSRQGPHGARHSPSGRQAGDLWWQRAVVETRCRHCVVDRRRIQVLEARTEIVHGVGPIPRSTGTVQVASSTS